MKLGGNEIAVCPREPAPSADAHHFVSTHHSRSAQRFGALRTMGRGIKSDPHWTQLAATALTTFATFFVFLIQGVIVARILGPSGRGEFGAALYFPRDIFLYAGLLGAVEVVTAYAARGRAHPLALRYSAARLGFITGCLTAVVAAMFSIALMLLTGKSYLIPFCLLVCLFVPFEQIHLTISSVDRGMGQLARYNLNRLVFALAFPVLALLAWAANLQQLTGLSWLWLMCGLFVISKLVGLLPTIRGMNLWSGIRRPWAWQSSAEPSGEREPRATELLRKGRPYAVSTFVTELFERLDIFLILALADVTTAGYYFVAIPAAAMLVIVPNALGILTFNAGAKPNFRVTRQMAAQVMLLTAAFQILTLAVFALIIERLIVLFFGASFVDAVPFALWLLPAMAVRGFLQAADGFLKGRHKPMIGVWARLASIVIMLAFVAITYSSWGLIAIPMAACAGQLVSAALIVPAIFVVIKDNPPTSNSGETK